MFVLVLEQVYHRINRLAKNALINSECFAPWSEERAVSKEASQLDFLGRLSKSGGKQWRSRKATQTGETTKCDFE